MNVSRETIAAALATLIGGPMTDGQFVPANMNPVLVTAGYKTFGRRLKLWTAVDASDKPALFLTNYDEEHDRSFITGPDKASMKFALVVYDDVSDPSYIPSQRMNGLLDAVDTVFRNATNKQTELMTLGDIVQHCWIEGEAKVSPGDLDNQSVAVYPIRVLVP